MIQYLFNILPSCESTCFKRFDRKGCVHSFRSRLTHFIKTVRSSLIVSDCFLNRLGEGSDVAISDRDARGFIEKLCPAEAVETDHNTA